MSKAIEFNIITNETIERELTEQEISQSIQYVAEMKIYQDELTAAAEAKATAKAALLDRLGITAEEAQLLLGGN